MTTININSIVEYKSQMDDEFGLTFTVIELNANSDWCKIQANVNMNFKPTYTANISDLKLN